MAEPKGEHGTVRRRWNGCRCQACDAAYHTYSRAKNVEYYRKNRELILEKQRAARRATAQRTKPTSALQDDVSESH